MQAHSLPSKRRDGEIKQRDYGKASKSQHSSSPFQTASQPATAQRCVSAGETKHQPPTIPTHPSPHPHLAAAAAAARTVSSPEVSDGSFPFTRSSSGADRRAPRHRLATVSAAAAAEDAVAGADRS
ncbi:hypothetical protein PVAP13_5KG567700 [Panicum virgatum]|uniref:Uncharacterized protein n=1 Tax=Panicum virgatum TaxID=38727 RepID=A0A8T0SYB3_PANVG|nr:hypothetical protein PVAP13_5KG567700 [Panicum virgatum]